MKEAKTMALQQEDSLQGLQKLSIAEALEALNTQASGLTAEEAAQRLTQYGKNVIEEKKGQPMIWKFLSNFTHLMAILLWAAGLVALLAGIPELAIAI